MFFTVQSLIVYGAELTLSGAMENLDCVQDEGDSDCANYRTRNNNVPHYPVTSCHPFASEGELRIDTALKANEATRSELIDKARSDRIEEMIAPK